MLIASQKKAEVFKYFTDKYDAEYSETFWDSSFDGENPAEIITQMVMDELVPIKLQQQMAVKYGILDSCNYSDFLKRLEKENAERKKKKENNEIVYGVTEYSEETYYNDELAKTIISLKEIWKKELNYGDSELMDFYEKVKDIYYRENPTGEVLLYFFPSDKVDKVASLLEKAKSGQNIDKDIEILEGYIQTCKTKIQKLYQNRYEQGHRKN